MKTSSAPNIMTFDPFNVASNAEEHNLGEAVYIADGRIFRYGVVASGAACPPGKVATAPVHITDHDNMACTATAIGATIVNVTPAGTGGAANIYAEGYLVISAGLGVGQTFQVKSHPTITGSVAFNVTLFDPIMVALDATSKASLVHNSYNNVLIGQVATVRPAGVPLVNVPLSNYGWFQTRGLASVLNNGGTAVGNTVVLDTGTAGAVVTGNTTYGTFQATMPVGKAVVAGVTAEYRPIWLEID